MKNYLFFLVLFLLIPFHYANAVTIEHTYVEQTTAQTHTGDTSWTDISGASISSASFTTGDKYLIIANLMSTSDSATTNIGIRTLHGSTAFAGSVDSYESSGTGQYRDYMYFTVWTAVASEGVKMQFMVDNSATTVTAEQISITAINLSDDVTENTDWFYDEVTASTSLGTTWSGWSGGVNNNAEIAFTPNGTDDWLILALGQVVPTSTVQNLESRINQTNTSFTPRVSHEGEDGTNDKFLETMVKSFTPSNSAHTFTQQSRNDGGSTGTREHSAIFALNLNKFESHDTIHTDAELTLDSTFNFATSTQIQTLNITPARVGDVLILGYTIFDANGGAQAKLRLQTDNADTPPTQTADNLGRFMGWDATRQPFGFIQTLDSLDTSAHTVDLDATAQAAQPVEDRHITILSMELAAAGGADTVNVSDEIALEDAGATPLLMGVVTVSDEIALEDAGVTTLLDGVVTVSDEIALEDASATTLQAGIVSVSDEIALEDAGATAATDTVFVSDEIALEDTASTPAPVALNYNAIVLSLNSPTLSRLGGAFAITCPANSTLTGLLTNGTFVCTDMSVFFP